MKIETKWNEEPPLMIFLLPIFLAVAITLIIAGILLTPSHQREKLVPTRPRHTGLSPAAPYGRDVHRASRRSVTINQQTHLRRVPLEVERQGFTNVQSSLQIGRLFHQSRAGNPTPWLGIILILIAFICFGILSLRTIFPTSAILMDASSPDTSVIPTLTTTSIQQKPSSQPVFPSTGASNALVRLNQLDPAQYSSAQEYDTWAYGACSAASMTEILNAYDSNHTRYRITDILKVEAGLHQITPDLGLLSPSGIDSTVAQFGFKATHLTNPSLDILIAIARSGNPVIINFPPYLWSGGHILVLRGGNSTTVSLADSSRLNMQTMSRTTFLKYWVGYAIVVIPIK